MMLPTRPFQHLSEAKVRQWIAACQVVVQAYKMSLAGIGPGYSQSNYPCAFCETADQQILGDDSFFGSMNVADCNTCIWMILEKDSCHGNYGDDMAECRIEAIEDFYIPTLKLELLDRGTEW